MTRREALTDLAERRDQRGLRVPRGHRREELINGENRRMFLKGSHICYQGDETEPDGEPRFRGSDSKLRLMVAVTACEMYLSEIGDVRSKGLGHLTSVSMPRPTGTQTRTFNYGTGAQLLSATNPENGTVTYTYNSDKTLAQKVDAKGQRIQYSYDSYKRITQVRRGVWGITPNVIVINAQRYGQTAITVMSGNSVVGSTSYGYDSSPQNFTFTTSLDLSQNNLRVSYNEPLSTADIYSLTLNGQQYQGYYDTCDDYNCYFDFYTMPAGGQTPGFQEDTCQREDYYYDTNPFDGSFSQYTQGRLAAVQYKGG